MPSSHLVSRLGVLVYFMVNYYVGVCALSSSHVTQHETVSCRISLPLAHLPLHLLAIAVRV